MQTTKYKTFNGVRAFRRWAIPYFNSCIHTNEFRPVLCYLFTEWHCNIDCHYCFQYDNHTDKRLPSMDLETAESAVDWLIEKQREGWPMVNSIAHLRNFKLRMRGLLQPWDCRAGHNGALIRTDGSLSPCFDLITYEEDWGRIWEPKFDQDRLGHIKKKCLLNCSSTCYHTMGDYYNLRYLPQWIGKHIRVG